jgi:uncharacterized membrane protein YfcA
MPGTVFRMGPAAMAGAFAGGWLASFIEPEVLKSLFALFLLISSVMIMFGTPRADAHGGFFRRISESYLPVLGFFTGLLGSMLGIGGGTIMIVPLILWFRLPVKQIAGTSSSVIIFIGLSGMISYMLFGFDAVSLPGWHTGYVWWSAAVPLAAGGVPMAQFGAWLNHRTHGNVLRKLFGLALFLIALRILMEGAGLP